ncbi:MAG TPA: response regulator [Pyrinomonadaceae bacterium]|jgi:DNA-binding response OmpR family regulator|nr:response regulator [Pyrinomonadaceae bacterium]
MTSHKQDDQNALDGAESRTALVVEDDQIIATVVEHLLSRRGFTVEIARDGRQALEFIEAKPKPAIVVLDVMLPYVDGFDLIKTIRGHATWSDVPVVMLTAKSQEQYIVRALDDGANDYVVKPFRPGELLARIRRVTKSS